MSKCHSIRLNLGILRHIGGGSVGPEKIPTSKYSGSWTIILKITKFGPPGAPQYFFSSEKSLELN